jgi:hypothetical protein
MGPLAERLRALADLVPVLKAPDADFGHWEAPPPVDGVHRMPYFEFGPTSEALRAALGRGGWIVIGFDWMAWMQTEAGQALRDRPEAVAAASPEDLAKLLIAIVRSARFVEGSFVGAFESDLLARIARRAAALLAEAHGQGRCLSAETDRVAASVIPMNQSGDGWDVSPSRHKLEMTSRCRRIWTCTISLG